MTDTPCSKNQAENTAPTEAESAEDAAKKLVEEKESEARTRSLFGFWNIFVTTLAVTWALFQMYVNTFSVLDAMKLRSWHIMFMLVLAFCMYPAFRGKNKNTPSLLDLLCIAGGLFAFGYLVLNYNDITMRGGFFLPVDYMVASLGVVISFEMARRVVPNLAYLAAAFMLYCFFGNIIPGAFGHTGFTWDRVVEHLFWGSQGLLGVGVGVSATYIFLFILFGTFLKYSGFSAFINDIALTLVGRTAGGPAKVSVIASALMGMINGSALANVATTGAITIPLMKRTGYRADFAAAVEAVASTGGQFAPPIMGAVGFIMAEFLGVPYTTVLLAAAIPAFLYYLTLLMAVHFEAKKLGLKGLAPENIPIAWQVMKTRGHLAIPLVVLLTFLFLGYTPLYAATFSIFATVVASWLKPSTRMSLATIIKALDEGARSAVGVGAACVIIGVIIGSVSLTGLGLTFGYEVLKYVGEGQLFLGGFFVMLMSIILGMGVPGVAAYVIVAAVAVPVLTKIGATPLAAHMFCLFYACLSNITPPVAMSSYVAAGIAKADQTKTSFIAMKLGITGFILPFFFLNNPLLLYQSEHNTLATLWALVSASLGVAALAAALQGMLFGPCNTLLRIVLLVVAFLAIDPNLITDAIGCALFAAVAIVNWRTTKHSIGTNQ